MCRLSDTSTRLRGFPLATLIAPLKEHAHRLGIQASDFGGEEDNKGADNRGNPLGSLMYSSAWGPGPKSPYIQSKDWSMFIGSGVFCFKVCDPSGPQSARLCEHVYDR